MWQEARKQEKYITSLMVNMQKRSERKNAYFKKLSRDPLQLIRLHGKRCNKYISDLTPLALDKQFLVPWCGDPQILIDRFDARAHLDLASLPKQPVNMHLKSIDHQQYLCNYERYRVIVMVESKGITEESYLQKLAYDFNSKKPAPTPKSTASTYAAVGYTYGNSEIVSKPTTAGSQDSDDEESTCDDSLASKPIDVLMNFASLPEHQKAKIDELAVHYGIMPGSFCSTLHEEQMERERSNFAKSLRGHEKHKHEKKARKKEHIPSTLYSDGASTNLSYAIQPATSEPLPNSDDDAVSSGSEQAVIPSNTIEYITEFSSGCTPGAAVKNLTPHPTKSVKVCRKKFQNLSDYSSTSTDSDSDGFQHPSSPSSPVNKSRGQLDEETQKNVSCEGVVKGKSPITHVRKAVVTAIGARKSSSIRDKLRNRTQQLLQKQLCIDTLEKKRKELEAQKAQEEREKDLVRLQRKLHKY